MAETVALTERHGDQICELLSTAEELKARMDALQKQLDVVYTGLIDVRQRLLALETK